MLDKEAACFVEALAAKAQEINAVGEFGQIEMMELVALMIVCFAKMRDTPESIYNLKTHNRWRGNQLKRNV